LTDDFENLTKTERRLFALFKDAGGRTLSHENLWHHTYAHLPECDWPESDIIKVIICNMRKKLPEFVFLNSKGIGYRMLPVRRDEAAPPPTEQSDSPKGNSPI
jgi:DNA-binding response OmpR family regulator